jgi:hypothetical protein
MRPHHHATIYAHRRDLDCKESRCQTHAHGSGDCVPVPRPQSARRCECVCQERRVPRLRWQLPALTTTLVSCVVACFVDIQINTSTPRPSLPGAAVRCQERPVRRLRWRYTTSTPTHWYRTTQDLYFIVEVKRRRVRNGSA